MLIIFFVFGTALYSQQVKLSGYVVDSLSGNPLISAYVYNQVRKVYRTTNQAGWFSVEGTAEDIIVISYTGYRAKKIRLDQFKGNDGVRIELAELPVILSEVKVEASAERQKILKQTGYQQFTAAEIKYMPSVGGESDITKVLQLMPGVGTSSEGSARLSIRGGEQDQNLILLDGVQVYNPMHLLGYFSSFSTDAINSVEFLKGYLPPEHAGKLSSVINIHLKEGNRERIKVSAGISFLSSQLMIEGPAGNNNSFMVSARRTYLDLANSLIGFADFNYSFSDIYGKFSFQLSPRDRLYLSGYYGMDNYSEKTQSSSKKENTNWGNQALHLRYNRMWSSSLFTDFSLIYSRYNSEYDWENLYKNPNLNEFTFKTVSDYNMAQGVNIRFGGDARSYRINTASGLQETNNTQSYQTDAFESNLFADVKIRLSDLVEFSLGSNASLFLSNFSGSRFSNIEPRIGASFFIDESAVIKAAFTGTHQYIHTLSSTSFYAPNDIFYPSNINLEPMTGSQVSLGFTRILNIDGSEYEFNIDAYYKDMQNIHQFKLNFYDANPDLLKEQLLFGKGWGYGIEFQFAKREGRLSGWINYTWNQSFRRITGKNNDNVYRPRFIREHQFNAVLNYNFSGSLKGSAVFVLASGLPVTLPVNKYSIIGETGEIRIQPDFIDYAELNGYTLPIYNRLDISLVYSFEMWGADCELSCSVYNVYNYKNPTFLRFSTIQGTFKSSTIGILPTIGIKFNF